MCSHAWGSARALALGAVLMPAIAAADHAQGLRPEPLGALAVGAISGALALVAGLLVLVVVMRLIRRTPPARDRTDST